MESHDKKQGIFSSTLKNYVSKLFQIKWTIRGKNITISIAPDERNNYISDEFANELSIPNSNICERLDFCKNKEYAISGLQWNIGDYTNVSQFKVKFLWKSDGDLVLGLPWLKKLGTFILNAEKKFLTFPYKNKKNHMVRHWHEDRIIGCIIWRIQRNIKDVVAGKWEINTDNT